MELENREVWTPVFAEDKAGHEYVTSFVDDLDDSEVKYDKTGKII